MKKLFVLVVTLVCVLLVSCSDNGKKRLRFVTGGESGTYYAFGSVIAQHVSNNTDVQVVGLAGNGSQSNVLALADGMAELGFCQSDVMDYAYHGKNIFAEQGKISGFSVLAALYQEQVQIVTVNSNIRSISDLRGKTVSIGAAGSGVYFNAIDILNAYGMTEQDITPTYQSFGDSAIALKDGKIDAAFIVAGAPTTAVTDLATAQNVSLLSIEPLQMEALLKTAPYYSPATIDKKAYGLKEDVKTLAVAAVILVRNDVPEDDVFSICSDIFDNAPMLGEAHAKYKELSLEYGASITTVPYHPGAAKYFQARGITVKSQVPAN